MLSPMISQCPVMVSLPRDTSFNFVAYPVGLLSAGTVLRGVSRGIFPRPILAMFGTFKPTVFEMCPSVSEAPSGTPALTKLLASGAAPIPTESSTTK